MTPVHGYEHINALIRRHSTKPSQMTIRDRQASPPNLPWIHESFGKHLLSRRFMTAMITPSGLVPENNSLIEFATIFTPYFG